MWFIQYVSWTPYVVIIFLKKQQKKHCLYSFTAFFPKIKRIGVEFWPVDREQIVCELQSLSSLTMEHSLHIPAGVLRGVSEKEKCYSYLELDSCFLFKMIHMWNTFSHSLVISQGQKLNHYMHHLNNWTVSTLFLAFLGTSLALCKCVWRRLSLPDQAARQGKELCDGGHRLALPPPAERWSQLN